MAGAKRRAKVTIRRYVMAVLSGMRGECVVCVCVCVWPPPDGGFHVPGLRPISLGCVLLFLYVRGQGFGCG
jgi:hypothetical protein